jgi:hypothetical protein
MADITKGQKIDLLAEIRTLLPDAEFCTGESWRGTDEVLFQDHCGCYSEYTTDPCNFEVFVSGTLPDDDDIQYDLRHAIESRLERWVKSTLTYSGCECCGEDSIYVSARVFTKKEAAANNEERDSNV